MGMDVSQAVKDFVIQSKELFHLLRREGRDLSDLELHMLRSQLHLLEIEATNLQTFKQLRPDSAA